MITTTTAATSDHRTRPRKKRAPSSRDQAIFLAYRAGGKSQAQLAEDNHLSQRRISEIVRRVEHWRANLLPAAAGELEPQQQARLERYLEQQRLQGIYDRAIRAYDTQPQELKTARQGDRDGKPYHDQTTRELPPNVQLLKVAQRAALDLGKLSDKRNDQPAPAAADQKDVDQRFWKVHDLIRDLRRDAGIPQDESLWSKDFAALTDALQNFIFRENADPAPRGADIPVCHSSGADIPVCHKNAAEDGISAANSINSEIDNAINSSDPSSNCSNLSLAKISASAASSTT